MIQYYSSQPKWRHLSLVSSMSTVSPLLSQTSNPLLQSRSQASVPLHASVSTCIVVVRSCKLHVLVLTLTARQQHRISHILAVRLLMSTATIRHLDAVAITDFVVAKRAVEGKRGFRLSFQVVFVVVLFAV